MSKPYKPILCLDFDGVIHSYTSGWKGARNIPDDPVPRMLVFMHDALGRGYDVVIHSSRARYFGGIRAMRHWLYKHSMDQGLWYEDMHSQGLEDVRFARWKPPAVLTIDDRAITFDGRPPDFIAVELFQPWNKKPRAS